MKLKEKGQIRGAIVAMTAGALVLGLAACDQIQSLWKGDKAATTAQAPGPAPITGQKIDLAKSGEMQKSAEAPKPDENALLAAKVKSALGADPALKMLAIDAGASDGVVTLYGTADTRAHREKAAQVASGVAGVKSVKNELVIVAGS